MFLAGVRILTCVECGSESVTISRLADLHDTVAATLIAKPAPLEGNEVRFLRKYAKLSSVKFAKLLGVDPAHLSRVENGHTTAFGIPTDRLVRAIVMAATNKDVVNRLLLGEWTGLWTGEKGRLLFRFYRKRWQAAA